MNETIEQIMSSRDAQERCSRWIEDVKNVPLEALHESVVKPKLEIESEEFIDTDSEFDSVSECGAKRRKLAVQLKPKLEIESEEFIDTDSEFDSVSECGAKRRKLAVQLKDEKLNSYCQWKNCKFNCSSVVTLVKHFANHVIEEFQNYNK